MLRILYVSLIAATLGFAACAGAQPAPDSTLNAARLTWDSLFIAGDYHGAAGLYTVDATLMLPGASLKHGRADILADFDRLYSQCSVKKEECMYEFRAGDDWAVERSHFTLDLTPKSGGGGTLSQTGHRFVGRKQVDGRWLIAWEIWDLDTPTN